MSGPGKGNTSTSGKGKGKAAPGVGPVGTPRGKDNDRERERDKEREPTYAQAAQSSRLSSTPRQPTVIRRVQAIVNVSVKEESDEGEEEAVSALNSGVGVKYPNQNQPQLTNGRNETQPKRPTRRRRKTIDYREESDYEEEQGETREEDDDEEEEEAVGTMIKVNPRTKSNTTRSKKPKRRLQSRNLAQYSSSEDEDGDRREDDGEGDDDEDEDDDELMLGAEVRLVFYYLWPQTLESYAFLFLSFRIIVKRCMDTNQSPHLIDLRRSGGRGRDADTGTGDDNILMEWMRGS